MRDFYAGHPRWVYWLLPTELPPDFDEDGRDPGLRVQWGYLCYVRDAYAETGEYLPGCSVGRTPFTALTAARERTAEIERQEKEPQP